MKNILYLSLILISQIINAQDKASVSGIIYADEIPLNGVVVKIIGTSKTIINDSLGTYKFENLASGKYKIQVSYIGRKNIQKNISIVGDENFIQDFYLEEDDNALDEVVVTGTLKAVRRSESPVQGRPNGVSHHMISPVKTASSSGVRAGR